MFKQLTTLAIIMLFALTLAACGGGGSAEPEATALPTLAPATETEPEEEAEPEGEAEDEAAPAEEPTPEPEEEAAPDEGDEHAEGEEHTEGDEHAEGGESAQMGGMMSDEAMGMMTAAMAAGEAGDWELVVTHMNHAIDMTEDADHKAAMINMLEEIEAGNTDQFAGEMQAMMDTMMGAMPKMDGMMSDEAMGMMTAAMAAGEAGDWELVVTHMNHAIDMTEDADHKAAMINMLEEIEAGNTDHFAGEMQAMMDTMMGAMPKMDGMMSDEAMGMMTAAMAAGEAGDWELVVTHMNHAIDMTEDADHKAAMMNMLEEIEAGDTDHFASEMQTMMDTMMGAMPKMSGTMSDEAMVMVTAALESAKGGDWETVATHMNHVLDLSTDAQQKSAVEHLLEEIEEGNTDHFIEEMEELMSAMMQVSPAMENMMAAMTAAQAGDWETVKQEMESAIDISTDPQEKSSLEHLLEEVDEGNADHFVEQLEAVMQGEEASH